MELTHTHEGLQYYTGEPVHKEGCDCHQYSVKVGTKYITWICLMCGAQVRVRFELEEPEEI